MKNIILSLVRDGRHVSYDLKIEGHIKNYAVLEDATKRVAHLLFSFKLKVYLEEGKLAYTVNRNFEDFNFSFDFVDADISKNDMKKIIRMYPFKKIDIERTKGKSKSYRENVKNNADIFNLPKLTDKEELEKTQLINIVEIVSKEAKDRKNSKRKLATKNKNHVIQNFRTFNKEKTNKQKTKKVNIWITILFIFAITIFVSAMAVYGVFSVHFHTWEPTYKEVIIHSLLSAGIVVSTIIYLRVYFGFKGGKNE